MGGENNYMMKKLKKMVKPIELSIPWLPKGLSAITLWPFIFYLNGLEKSMPLRSHEYYHWYHARKFGVLPWYLTYLFLRLLFIKRPIHEHPFEKPAYAEEFEVEQLIKSHKKTSDYLEKKYFV
jgi:hypothetical protein